jgi:hypothetical protein
MTLMCCSRGATTQHVLVKGCSPLQLQCKLKPLDMHTEISAQLTFHVAHFLMQELLPVSVQVLLLVHAAPSIAMTSAAISTL